MAKVLDVTANVLLDKRSGAVAANAGDAPQINATNTRPAKSPGPIIR